MSDTGLALGPLTIVGGAVGDQELVELWLQDVRLDTLPEPQ